MIKWSHDYQDGNFRMFIFYFVMHSLPLRHRKYIKLNHGDIINVQKMFRRPSQRLLNVLCTLNLRLCPGCKKAGKQWFRPTTGAPKICLKQKQPSKGVLKKKYSENMQQIYRRTPIPKCEQLHWNHTLVWVFSCKFAA